MTRSSQFVAASLCAVVVSACGSSNPAAPSAPGATVTAVTVASTSSSASTFQLTATARLSDNTTRDVTALAAWQSSNASLAAVSSTGVVTVVGSGEVDVRATYQSVSGSLHLLVTKVPVTAVALSGGPSPSATGFQLTASAKLADGTMQDVTRSADWSSSNPQLATVSGIGYVTVIGSGEIDVRATYQGVTGSVHFTVSMPKTFSLTGVVTEAPPTVRPLGGARVQVLVGNYGTTDGLGAFAVSGLTVGRNLIEVSKEGYETVETEVTVIDRDVQLSIALKPAPPKNADGATATARCADGSWSWAQTAAQACTANGGVAYPVCPGPLCSQPAASR
jgi:hypothetical protein